MTLHDNTKQYDVVIIGAGPSGAVAGALLVAQGLSVLILEKQFFPRFSIGESLLPQCMVFLQQAGLEQTVLDNADRFGFQFKNGAAFHKNSVNGEFDFNEKFSSGPGTTFQVKRASFDKLLADEASAKGVEIRYGHQVNAVKTLQPKVVLDVEDVQQVAYQVTGKFLLDASGFGRVLPRLLDLEQPSDFPIRHSFFSHFSDGIDCPDFDRNKILITVHPKFNDVWYWLIPFSDGTASIGVVGIPERFETLSSPGASTDSSVSGAALSSGDILADFINQDEHLKNLLKNAKPIQEVRSIKGYSANVKQLHGENYALLGNAGEFLDPVFSSGVTIALKSASLAAPLVVKQLQGEVVNWQAEYAQPLKFGVDTFRTFVEAWYDGRFQDVIFHDSTVGNNDGSITKMLSSILAGYAWDDANPYVAKSKHRLAVLAEICKQ